MKTYVRHHLHDDTSNANGYADSCTKYTEYIDLAKKEGCDAIAFSNHGGIYDWVKKKQACDKANIKYIHGVESYLCINLQDNTRGYHIGLYSKNWDGVLELNALVSKSTSKGTKKDKSDRHMYYNPRISFEELMNTSDNIIVTTACLASPLWQLGKTNVLEQENGEELYNYNIKKRDELLQWLSKNNHRCFLEIQYHNCDNQIKFNKLLYKWSEEYNIPLIVGTDTHSSTPYKAECRKILQKAKDSFYGEEDSFDLTWKTYDELVECFNRQNSLPNEVVLEAIENTNKLADMVENFKLDRTFKYPTLYGEDARVIWKNRILKMFDEKINNNIIDINRIDEYRLQMAEEFDVMCKLGMESFMMFMSELMEWAKKNDIHSSPCRGSVGGSLIAFITDIISVDPIKWKTVFSRFCNADRISLGDIDEDFAPNDREKVYKYIIDRFGNKNVSYILTLGTIQDRGSIDVLAKGLNYKNLDLVKEIKNKFDKYFDEFSKIIHEEVNLEELEGATSSSPNFDDYELYMNVIRNDKKSKRVTELKELWGLLREENKELFYYFDGIKGTIISKGSHPSGMIGSPITLYDNLGVFYKDGDENIPISFCAMKAVDFLNFVKFDILGLKTIGILQDTYKLIGKPWEEDYAINWNDDNVWNDMITCNAGIFQFEGDYAFDLLKQFKPHAINDMSLVNASLRPSGKSYRNRLIGGEINKNPSTIIDELLSDNRGFLVFQEDTIAFLQQICGMSGSEADTTRRAIGKKDEELLKEQLPKILEGYCKNSPHDREIAEREAKEFIQIVEDSSEYQFGYNHSTGYSMNGYKCARLRYYYPLEFVTAYLNNAENEVDINNGMKMASVKNITINPPKFRYSKGGYYPNRETNSIYKGIGSIKYCNEQIGEDLYALRDNQYNTFVDLLVELDKTSLDTRQLDILIKLDFFDEFGGSLYLLKVVELYNNIYSSKQFSKEKITDTTMLNLLYKYSNKQTAKLFKEVDTKSLLNELISTLDKTSNIDIYDRIKAESEFVGYLSYKDSSYDSSIMVVTEIKINRWGTPYVKLYRIMDGHTAEIKVNKKYYNNKPIEKLDVIKVNIIPKKKKRQIDGEWKEIDEEEFILNSYGRIVKDNEQEEYR